MDKNKTLIIAEAGVNHNGSFENAIKLIDIAKNAGADIVKFQTFKTENIVTKDAPTANYQNKSINSNTQYDLLKKLELTYEEFTKLKTYCDKQNIIFTSSPFDLQSAEFLMQLNVPYIKIPSGEITNYPLIKYLAKFNKNVIISTGLSTIKEIKWAIDLFTKNGTSLDNISILHCNTQYPTPYEDVNLNVIQTLIKKFKIRVGYSDHTLGIEIPLAAVALGATIIEKHFTLDKTLPGPDQSTSLDPTELKEMITKIRNIEKALGSNIKYVTNSEIENLKIVRKSIVASKNIKKGEPFTEDNITTKRPGFGLSPIYWEKVIGKTAKRDFQKDEFIEL